MQIPTFGIGETTGVREYVEQATLALCGRLGVSQQQEEEILRLALESIDASISLMVTSLTAGMVEATPQARAFWNAIGEIMVSEDSKLVGLENLVAALEEMKKGKNILVIQNHRSGADTMVMEILVNRALGTDVVTKWAYMSGHAVNLYLIPLMFTLAMRRFQIFSVKYRSGGLIGSSDAAMARQNTRAMMALRRYCATGGKLIAFYPEGGRGETGMKLGEPRTVCVPQIMHRASDRGLVILPTYVDGATNVLPVHRGDNEYNEIFVHAQRGTATLTVGHPVSWEDIQPSDEVVRGIPDSYRNGDMGNEPDDAIYKSLVVDTMLGLVANLAPNDQKRGPYASPEMRSLVSRFTEGGAHV